MASFDKYYYGSSTVRSLVETALPCTNHFTVSSSLIKEYDSLNFCWYTPVLPGADGANPWEKDYFVPIYRSGIQLSFLAKRTYFAPSGSTAGNLWGTYSWSTTSNSYSDIYLLHQGNDTFAICSSINSNPSSYTANNVITTFTPKTDRIAVFFSGGGGGGSAPWSGSNGAGGGGAGTICLIMDLSVLRNNPRLYKFSFGSPAGYSGSGWGTSGGGGGTSYIYSYYRAGNSDSITRVAYATGGGGGSSSGGGSGGVGYISYGLDSMVWKIPGINYGTISSSYAHGQGARGGNGGGTGSAGSGVSWTACAMYDDDGDYAGAGCTTTMSGGNGGLNVSGGGGASYWGNGAGGVGATATAGYRGTNGSGGSGARYTWGGKEGGPGGYSYLRICWTGSAPSAPAGIYPSTLSAPECGAAQEVASHRYSVAVKNNNSVTANVVIDGDMKAFTISSGATTTIPIISTSSTAKIRLARAEGDWKASSTVTVTLSGSGGTTCTTVAKQASQMCHVCSNNTNIGVIDPTNPLGGGSEEEIL